MLYIYIYIYIYICVCVCVCVCVRVIKNKCEYEKFTLQFFDGITKEQVKNKKYNNYKH